MNKIHIRLSRAGVELATKNWSGTLKHFDMTYKNVTARQTKEIMTVSHIRFISLKIKPATKLPLINLKKGGRTGAKDAFNFMVTVLKKLRFYQVY